MPDTDIEKSRVTPEKMGDRFRAARLNARYTQKQVEQATHINSKSISNWENDLSYPNLNDTRILANLYGVSADFLLGVKINEATKVKPVNCLDLVDILYPHDAVKRMQLRSITLDGAVPDNDALYRLDPAQIAAIRQFVDLALEASKRSGASKVEIKNEGDTDDGNHQDTIPKGNQKS